MFDKFRTPGWDVYDKNDPNKYDAPSSGIMEDWYRSGSLMANLVALIVVPGAFIGFFISILFYCVAEAPTVGVGVENFFILSYLILTHWATYVTGAVLLWCFLIIYSVMKRDV